MEISGRALTVWYYMGQEVSGGPMSWARLSHLQGSGLIPGRSTKTLSATQYPKCDLKTSTWASCGSLLKLEHLNPSFLFFSFHFFSSLLFSLSLSFINHSDCFSSTAGILFLTFNKPGPRFFPSKGHVGWSCAGLTWLGFRSPQDLLCSSTLSLLIRNPAPSTCLPLPQGRPIF